MDKHVIAIAILGIMALVGIVIAIIAVSKSEKYSSVAHYKFKSRKPNGSYVYTPYENDHPLVLPPNPSRPDWFSPLTNTRAPADLSPYESGSWLSSSVFKGRRPYKNQGVGYTDERGWL